ncbi:MAG TPA: hypothetical protein VFR51_08445, partial [Pyrinomonadaceae bacterium]|nr:hypothetical protein [Pyrinomonadaceae bacterium]
MTKHVREPQMLRLAFMFFAAILAAFSAGSSGHTQNRPRAREAGVKVGVLPTGGLNAITDVQGLLV